MARPTDSARQPPASPGRKEVEPSLIRSVTGTITKSCDRPAKPNEPAQQRADTYNNAQTCSSPADAASHTDCRTKARSNQPANVHLHNNAAHTDGLVQTQANRDLIRPLLHAASVPVHETENKQHTQENISSDLHRSSFESNSRNITHPHPTETVIAINRFNSHDGQRRTSSRNGQ